MSNWLAGGTSAFDVASRQYRMRFKPPATFRQAMEKSTAGTDNFYKNYVREEWTPYALDVNSNAVSTTNVLYTCVPHIFDFGTFRLDAGYEVVYAMPRLQMGVLDIVLTPRVSRLWVNVAIVSDRQGYGTTPPKCFLLYQTMINDCDPPLVLKGIALASGDEIRVSSTSTLDVSIMGPIAAEF